MKRTGELNRDAHRSGLGEKTCEASNRACVLHPSSRGCGSLRQLAEVPPRPDALCRLQCGWSPVLLFWRSSKEPTIRRQQKGSTAATNLKNGSTSTVGNAFSEG